MASDASETKEIHISSGGRDYHQPAAELLTECFKEDPVICYMMSSISDETRLAYLPAYMSSLVKAAVLNQAVVQEANDWSCCAIWMLPGNRVDNPFTMLQAGLISCVMKLGIGGIKRMLWDYQRQSDACKRKGLLDAQGKEMARYHYLFFIATDPAARGQGLASEIVSQYQDTATADDLPIWLEATTAHSRDVYTRLGFETVHEMKLGEGTHASSGAFEKDGAGVSIWAMIWKPSRHVKDPS